MKIGVNTFGIGKLLREDFSGTLGELREAGITAIEPMVLFMGKEGGLAERLSTYTMSRIDQAAGVWPVASAGEMFDAVRAEGFAIRSVHMAGPGWKRNCIDRAIAFAKEQDIAYYVLSFNQSSVTEMAKEVAELKKAARRFRENGIGLLMHNHEAEWKDCGGENVFSFLMEQVPELDVELDVGWVKYAGLDCVEIMRQYRDRIRILHFKDVREGAGPRTRATCFTAIGEGSIPLADILEEAEEMDLDEVGFVLDQDASLGSMLEDICVSVKNIRQGAGFSAKGKERYQGGLKLSLMTFPMIRDRMRRKLNLEELCSLIKESGLECVDIMEHEVKLYGGAAKVQQAFVDRGIRLECLISTISMIRGRDRAIKRGIHNALVMARELNCSMLMIVPFPQMAVRMPGLPSRQEMVANAIKYLRLAVIAGRKYGVKICIEDTPTCQLPLSSIAECREILAAVPGLGLAYDTANMIPAGDDPMEFYEKLKSRICHVHLKDVRKVREKGLDVCLDGRVLKSCVWGEGIVPIRRIVQRLEADGYSGSCGIEYVAPEQEGLYPNQYQLERFLAYLNRDEGDGEIPERE